jgi:hypothetical protein
MRKGFERLYGIVRDRLSCEPLSGQFEGILQTDGYAAYDQIGGPRMVHAACWSHARRQFFEAVQLNSRDPVATPTVAWMNELFAVDAEARRKALTTAERHIRRQETARPLLDDIGSKIEAAHSAALPSSALSKACQYALALWKKLTRFLEHPELELSTNQAENFWRPVALGRNYVHSRIMFTPQGKKCMIPQIDGPFRQEPSPPGARRGRCSAVDSVLVRRRTTCLSLLIVTVLERVF